MSTLQHPGHIRGARLQVKFPLKFALLDAYIHLWIF
jgi:hypothetical protein